MDAQYFAGLDEILIFNFWFILIIKNMDYYLETETILYFDSIWRKINFKSSFLKDSWLNLAYRYWSFLIEIIKIY